jgi:hypothetical protein
MAEFFRPAEALRISDSSILGTASRENEDANPLPFLLGQLTCSKPDPEEINKKMTMCVHGTCGTFLSSDDPNHDMVR